MRRVRFGVVGLILILMSVTFGVGVYAAANPKVSLSGEVTYTPRTKESYLYKDWKVTLNSNGISPSSITSVKFTNSKSDVPSGVTGVSVGANDSTNSTPFDESNTTYYNVMAYKNGNALVLFSEVPIFAPEDSSFLFSHASNANLRFNSATSFNLSNLDTSKTTSMANMMLNLTSISNLDLSNFNTENVTSMANMFDGCTSLTNVNLSSFNTANVSSMNNMFNNCSALTSLNLSSFNIARGTTVTSLLNGCSKLNTINAPKSNAVAISLPTQTTASYYKTTALSTPLTQIPASSATSTIKLGYNLTANANNGSISASTGWTGTGSTASKVVLFDNNAIGILPSASRANYGLKGWYTATTGGTKIATNTKFTQHSSIFAQWNANTYNITYNMNGGTNPSSNPTTFTYSESTQTKTIANPTKVGYDFGGWTVTNGSISGNTLTINAGATSVTLTANWDAQKYAITYRDQGNAAFSGTHASGYPTQHTYGTATTLKSASKTGYAFGGWFTSSNCSGTAVTSLGATAYSADITLYAKWTANTYNITYVMDGGTNPSSNPTTFTYSESTQTKTIANPTKTGYTFGGWTVTNGSISGTTLTIDAKATSVTLTANWSASNITLTASYVGNGYNLDASLNLEANKTVYIAVVGFTEGSYNISAYESLEEAEMGFFYCEINTVVYSGSYEIISENIVKITTGNSNATIALKLTTLTANASGGTIAYTSGWIGSGDSVYKELKSGAQYGTLPTATKTGYSFVGWYTLPTGGTQVTNTTIMSSDSTTIYARWAVTTYFVQFGINDNIENQWSDTVEYNEILTVPAGIYGNNIFRGWKLNKIYSTHYIDFNNARWGTSANNVTNRLSEDGVINCMGTIYIKNLASSGSNIQFFFDPIFEPYTKTVYVLCYENDTTNTFMAMDYSALRFNLPFDDDEGTKYLSTTNYISSVTLKGVARTDFTNLMNKSNYYDPSYTPHYFIHKTATTADDSSIGQIGLEERISEAELNVTRDMVIIIRFYASTYKKDPFITVSGATYYVNPRTKKIYTSYDGSTYSNEINSITVPTSEGRIYLGAYDINALNGGTQYITADGTFTDAARNITESVTIYHRSMYSLATNLQFEVRYSATSEYASVYMTWEPYFSYAMDYWEVTLYKDGIAIGTYPEISANTLEIYNETLSRTAGTYYFTVKGYSMAAQNALGYTETTANTSATREAYKLFFGTDGGKLLGGTYDHVYLVGTNGDPTPIFTQTGSEIDYWYTNYNGNIDQFSDTVNITNFDGLVENGVIYVYLRWKDAPILIFFKDIDGDDNAFSTELPYEYIGREEYAVYISIGDNAPTTSRSGYTFLGWSTTNGGPVAFKDTFYPQYSNGNLIDTYYSVWESATPTYVDLDISYTNHGSSPAGYGVYVYVTVYVDNVEVISSSGGSLDSSANHTLELPSNAVGKEIRIVFSGYCRGFILESNPNFTVSGTTSSNYTGTIQELKRTETDFCEITIYSFTEGISINVDFGLM